VLSATLLIENTIETSVQFVQQKKETKKLLRIRHLVERAKLMERHQASALGGIILGRSLLCLFTERSRRWLYCDKVPL